MPSLYRLKAYCDFAELADCLSNIVPGNHDLDRSLISRGARAIVKDIDSRDALNEVLSTDQDRQLVMRKFTQFDEFINGYADGNFILNDKFYCKVYQFKMVDKSLAVLALNSAWLCMGDEDRNHLALAERQVRDALAAAKDADLRIALMHHPWAFFPDWDSSICQAEINRACDLVLRGHLHSSKVEERASAHSSILEGAAGAVRCLGRIQEVGGGGGGRDEGQDRQDQRSGDRRGRDQAECGLAQQVVGRGGKFGAAGISPGHNFLVIIPMGDQPVLLPYIEELVNGQTGFIIEVTVQIADTDGLGFRQALF